MKLQESGEMYLEYILRLSHDKKEIHAKDIADVSGFSKPSVSRAVGLLQKGGYIEISDVSKVITLTDTGCKIAERIYERHIIMQQFFMEVGVSEETAAEDACRIEHFLSDETFDAIKKHLAEEHPEIKFPKA